METNTQNTDLKPGRPAATLIAAVLIGIAAAFFPLALPVVPAYWAYAMCKTKPGALLLLGGVFAGASVLLAGVFGGACLTVLCAGMTAALYYLQTRKLGNANTVATGSGVALFALYALVCVPGILSGDGAFASMQAVASAATEVFRETAAMLPAQNADAMAQLNEYLDAYVAAVPALVVPVLSVTAGLTGLLAFLLFRAFARNKGLNINPLRAFRLWSIPPSLATGLIVMLAGSFVLNLAGWDYADALSGTVNAIAGMPLLLQGLCVLDYMLVRRGGNVKARRVATYIATGLLLWVAQMPLIMLGCLDQLLRFRARASMPPPAQPL